MNDLQLPIVRNLPQMESLALFKAYSFFFFFYLSFIIGMAHLIKHNIKVNIVDYIICIIKM